MRESLLHAFVTLFVVIDPIGQIGAFVALTHGHSPRERRAMAIRAVLIAAAVLYAFALLGEALLRALGISLPALKIAGGVLLFLLAIDMIFALDTGTGIRTTTSQELAEAERRRDISVFPLAIPLIAGPGAFTSVTLLVARAEGDPWQLGLLLVLLAAVLGLNLLFLLAATGMMRLLGVTGANVIGRVLGILLAALAVQFVLNGLGESGLLR
jgi:multiple antibiotic resistance protein